MSIGSSPFQGGGGSSSIADASETTAGKIRIATSAEATTGTNDLTAMTPLTVKERIDAALVGGLEYQGTFNATTGLPSLANAEKGDLYRIATGGTIYGQDWSIGDHLIINTDMGGSITNSKIDKVDNTDDDASETVKGVIRIATSAEATTGTNDLTAMTPLTVKERIDALNLGTASTQDVGTSASNVVQLDGSARLPAVDGSQLTNLPSASDASETTKGIIEIATSAEATTGTDDLKAMTPLTVKERIDALSLGTASTQDVGTSANNVVQLDGSARLPAVDGSQLTNLPTASAASETTAGIIEIATSAEATTGTDDLKAMTPLTVKERIDALSSTYQPLDAGLTSIAALTTAANKMLFTDGSDSYDTTDLTVFARSLLDDANATAARTTLGAIAELSEDSSPQLGGDLDLNGNDITTTSNANLELAPHGIGVVNILGNTTGGNNQGAIRLNCEQNSHHITIKSPTHSALQTGGSYSLTLPANDGDPNQVLQTDGSGALSWVDQASGGGTSYTYSAITATTTAQAWYHYSVNTSGGAVTINLPALSTLTDGDEIRIKLRVAGNNLTIDANGSETIDGGATYTLDVAYQSITLVVGSTEWEII